MQTELQTYAWTADPPSLPPSLHHVVMNPTTLPLRSFSRTPNHSRTPHLFDQSGVLDPQALLLTRRHLLLQLLHLLPLIGLLLPLQRLQLGPVRVEQPLPLRLVAGSGVGGRRWGVVSGTFAGEGGREGAGEGGRGCDGGRGTWCF